MRTRFNLSQDSWLPATDYPRASRSFPRIAGSGNEIGVHTGLGWPIVGQMTSQVSFVSTSVPGSFLERREAVGVVFVFVICIVHNSD
jgi:hypothetical protein